MVETIFILFTIAFVYFALWQLVIWVQMFNADDDK